MFFLSSFVKKTAPYSFITKNYTFNFVYTLVGDYNPMINPPPYRAHS